MSITLNRHLKAVYYPGSLIDDDPISVTRYLCMTVQHYSYQFNRSRDKAGIPFGQTNSSVLEFSVRLLNPADGNMFYERLRSNEVFASTFLFNATFSERQRLNNYEDAMEVKGYVIDVTDDYDSTPSADGTAEQVIITVKILLTSVTYLSRENERNRHLIIHQS